MGYNKEDQRNYMREYARKRRRRALEYLGGECVKCGTKNSLEIDHINRADKLYEIKNLLFKSWPVQVGELDKCQILCKEHHRAKTSEESRGFTHGTIYGWMKIKCDCATCYKAKRLWHDKRNAARRKSA